jgi:hypothetical protein
MQIAGLGTPEREAQLAAEMKRFMKKHQDKKKAEKVARQEDPDEQEGNNLLWEAHKTDFVLNRQALDEVFAANTGIATAPPSPRSDPDSEPELTPLPDSEIASAPPWMNPFNTGVSDHPKNRPPPFNRGVFAPTVEGTLEPAETPTEQATPANDVPVITRANSVVPLVSTAEMTTCSKEYAKDVLIFVVCCVFFCVCFYNWYYLNELKKLRYTSKFKADILTCVDTFWSENLQDSISHDLFMIFFYGMTIVTVVWYMFALLTMIYLFGIGICPCVKDMRFWNKVFKETSKSTFMWQVWERVQKYAFWVLPAPAIVYYGGKTIFIVCMKVKNISFCWIAYLSGRHGSHKITPSVLLEPVVAPQP